MDGVRRYLASLASSLSTLSPRSPLRLERENELEDQRRRTLVAEGKLKEKADAAKPKEQSRQPTMAAGVGAPGRSDQLAMVG